MRAFWAAVAVLGLALSQEMYLLPAERGSPLEGGYSFRLFREGDSVRVVISVQLSNNALQFVRFRDGFVARFRIDAAVYRGDELVKSVASAESVVVDEFSQTNLSTPWRAASLAVVLPKGKYSLHIVLTDLNARTKARSVAALKVPDPRRMRLSTPWLFVPGSDSLIISDRVPLLWDSLGVAAVAYDVPESALCEVELFGVRYRSRTFEGKLSVRRGDTLALGFLPLAQLSGGNYTARIVLKDKTGRKLAQKEIRFVVVQTPSSMYRLRFDELLRQLELIANPSEIKALEAADSTERDSLWEEFWRRRDPTPTTEYNEAKEEFFRRVEYANEHFGTPTRPGWETDRGRAYITYGQPDEIERHPFEIDSYPYEIWYYYSLGLTLIFVDYYGDGDYRLKETR